MQLLENGSSIILRSSNGKSNMETGLNSHAQRGLPIHKIPGQTGARKVCSCRFRQPVTTKATACEQNLSNHHSRCNHVYLMRSSTVSIREYCEWEYLLIFIHTSLRIVNIHVNGTKLRLYHK